MDLQNDSPTISLLAGRVVFLSTEIAIGTLQGLFLIGLNSPLT